MNNMNKGSSLTIILIVAALVLIGGGLWYYNGARQQQAALEEPLPPPPEDISPPSSLDGTTVEIGAEDEIKEFAVTGRNFEFSVKEIRVNRGDFVRIHFTSADGFHDWKADDFKAATERVDTGETSSVDFIADKTGTFEFYCSVGSHRQMGMAGKLVVE